MVLGVPRSGTSCVAGCLHRLGVDMGEGHFQPNDWANPKGYYEDMRWRLRTQRITGRGYSLKAANIESIGQRQRAVYHALALECAQRKLWGMKDPWLCFVGSFIWPILEDCDVETRLVVVRRPREASIASVAGHLHRTYGDNGNAERIIDTWLSGLDRQLSLWRGPVHIVDYDRLVTDPLPHVQALANYAYDGLGRASGGVEDVAHWVSPKLRHHQGGDG